MAVYSSLSPLLSRVSLSSWYSFKSSRPSSAVMCASSRASMRKSLRCSSSSTWPTGFCVSNLPSAACFSLQVLIRVLELLGAGEFRHARGHAQRKDVEPHVDPRYGILEHLRVLTRVLVRGFNRVLDHPVTVVDVLCPALLMAFGGKGRLTQMRVLRILQFCLVEEAFLYHPLPRQAKLCFRRAHPERYRADEPLAGGEAPPTELRVHGLLVARTPEHHPGGSLHQDVDAVLCRRHQHRGGVDSSFRRLTRQF